MRPYGPVVARLARCLPLLLLLVAEASARIHKLDIRVGCAPLAMLSRPIIPPSDTSIPIPRNSASRSRENREHACRSFRRIGEAIGRGEEE